MFVRSKVIHGHRYYYLVQNQRHGQKVRQKVVKYLGKDPWAQVAPVRFVYRQRKDYKRPYLQIFRSFGISVHYDVPADADEHAYFDSETKEVHFSATPTAFDMAHELAHLIDNTIGEDAARRSGQPRPTNWLNAKWRKPSNPSDELTHDGFDDVMQVSDHVYQNSVTYLDKLAQWQARHPELTKKLDKEIAAVDNFLRGYPSQTSELFADLFALAVTEPRKARTLAPNATAWLMKTLYEHPQVREEMTKAGFWQLGTTDTVSPATA